METDKLDSLLGLIPHKVKVQVALLESYYTVSLGYSGELSHTVCVFTLGWDHAKTTIEFYMYKDLEGKEIIKAKL